MEYRTPREEQVQAEHDARVRTVLDQAVRDGASLKAAMAYGEPPEVVERWVDAFWDGLRDNLTDRLGPGLYATEDRLTAIVLLLEGRIDAEFGRLTGPMTHFTDEEHQ